jgi:hypothetical protein
MAPAGRRRVHLDLNRAAPRDAWVLVSAAGTLAYVVYLQTRFHAPLAFVQGERAWEQSAGLHTWLKLALASRIVHPPYGRLDLTIFLQAGLTIAALCFVPLVVRRLGWGYGAYAVCVIAIPALGTKDLGAMGRYLLAAFPVFAVLGGVLATRRRTAAAYFAVSTTLLFIFLVLWAHEVYVT